MIGITAYGAYIPRLRLDRGAVFRGMGWFAPALLLAARGERAMGNWDEDALTMAVAAGRDCLKGVDRAAVEALWLASTTMPFADRQNAGIAAAALGLKEELFTADLGGSQKAGTAALLAALEAVAAGRRQVLVAAADRRETKAAYFHEMWFGDGAAALAVGAEGVIAEYLGAHSLALDFVDHYRGAQKTYDYNWEERWARDAGYAAIIPAAVRGLLEKLHLEPADVDRIAFPCLFQAEHRRIAAALGFPPEKVVDPLHDTVGETGAAHPLLLLVHALESARPGERILVCSFGQGADALLFRVTEALARLAPRRGVAGHLARRQAIDNYPKWLKFRELITVDMGIRAEAPTQTAVSALWRKRRMILGLEGGRCRQCGTPQFPRMDICVNPQCGALHSQEPCEFADRPARIMSYTGDLLAVSVDPPALYGMVEFEGGGRMMADFTDCGLEELRVGGAVEMVFRRKAVDRERGFVNYFWKAAPLPAEAPATEPIRFDGRVAIVTGAGGGLGRLYALELARRGAKVVVNDLGGARDGSGAGSPGPAESVAAEIRAAGGQAVANSDSVATAAGGRAIVAAALEAFGRVDILINNAGILRDRSFPKMAAADWQAVLDVHLNGAYHVTRPALEAMKANGYGRIVFTTSAAGLYGNYGQANYAAAKMALVGLMASLRLEARRHGVIVNTVAPFAVTRLSEEVIPPELKRRAAPEFVAPLVLYLASERCTSDGAVFNTGMGHVSRAAMVMAPPVALGEPGAPATVERIHAEFSRIDALEGGREMPDANAAIAALLG